MVPNRAVNHIGLFVNVDLKRDHANIRCEGAYDLSGQHLSVQIHQWKHQTNLKSTQS